ncbi:MAG: ABC transporter permease, partial [Nitrospirales bacterium]
MTGLLRKEPDRVANLFSLGPRVMVSREALAATQLVQPGSRVRERYLLKVPAEVTLRPLMYELRGRLADERSRVLAYHDAQPRLRRFLDNLSRYLGLIGLTALFVGGIGVATTVQAFLREKFTTIAILKTLGADSQTILRTYLLQAMLFGLLGSGVGALVGVGLQRALPPLLTGFLPHEMVNLPPPSFGVAVVPVLKGLAMGMLTTLVFALWPLLRVREIRPAFIFRREVETGEGAVSVSPGPSDPGPRRTKWRGVRAVLVRLQGLDRVSGISAGLIASGLLALAMWEARSVAVGLLFIGGLTAAVMLLLVTAWGLVRGLARLARGGLRPGSLAVRQALANVYRPGSQATAVLVSVGVGVTLIVAVALVERALIQQLGENRPDAAPTFFFIDIQPDQADKFRRLLAARVPEAHPEITPLVRSRLHAINGETIKGDERPEEGQERREGGRQTWYYTRDYVLTFLQDLPEDNVVVRGEWWAGRPIGVNGLAEVSVEEEAARQLGLTLGTTVALDIQ